MPPCRLVICNRQRVPDFDSLAEVRVFGDTDAFMKRVMALLCDGAYAMCFWYIRVRLVAGRCATFRRTNATVGQMVERTRSYSHAPGLDLRGGSSSKERLFCHMCSTTFRGPRIPLQFH